MRNLVKDPKGFSREMVKPESMLLSMSQQKNIMIKPFGSYRI